MRLYIYIYLYKFPPFQQWPIFFAYVSENFTHERKFVNNKPFIDFFNHLVKNVFFRGAQCSETDFLVHELFSSFCQFLRYLRNTRLRRDFSRPPEERRYRWPLGAAFGGGKRHKRNLGRHSFEIGQRESGFYSGPTDRQNHRAIQYRISIQIIYTYIIYICTFKVFNTKQ